jgi:hypothetical protein
MRKAVDNVKIDIKELGYKCVDWIKLTQYMIEW